MNHTSPVRWGILGTGNIARQFARGLSQLPDAQLVAVGSRRQDTADAFGEQFAVPRRYATYAQLAADPDVDVVYIATPHASHEADTVLCLTNDKAVLCEKPFALSAAQAKRMIALARQRNLFLMEALWTRFLPAVREASALVHAGAIGSLRMVQGDFGYRMKFDPDYLVFNPALGGGALLDVGVYPLSVACHFLQPATAITATGVATMGQLDVDEQCAFTVSFSSGAIAVCSSATRTDTGQEMLLWGDAGMIRLHAPFWKCEKLTLCPHGKPATEMLLPLSGNDGYHYEAAHIHECLRDGLTESLIMPLDESLDILILMDALRSQWGVRYPSED